MKRLILLVALVFSFTLIPSFSHACTEAEAKVASYKVASYKKLSTSELAKKAGYNWTKDKTKLAKKAGMKYYNGTRSQNLKIRNMLLQKLGAK